jgi:hypothetical protein
MQSVALGQGWDRTKVEELVKRAIASEPGYYYYYRAHAYSLMPQWNGEDGDAAKFAEQSADRVGGDAGDILYFQIGAKIVCACNEPEFGRLWPRLQKGYALLEKQYGVSLANLNRLALMATKSKDSVVADSAFNGSATAGTSKRGPRRFISIRTRHGPLKSLPPKPAPEGFFKKPPLTCKVREAPSTRRTWSKLCCR